MLRRFGSLRLHSFEEKYGGTYSLGDWFTFRHSAGHILDVLVLDMLKEAVATSIAFDICIPGRKKI